ncbi:NAD(P)H pyrophosphatase NUDT13, mitochondrial isoform X2 [Ascaphus truei]|uniref:NAD(P)H pyrophosphatase NUDT13, mitochondrial isoform X2 n=1 Tax=Ascaphus truei TaxID=8439 RepID=UPI003F5AC125
MFRGVSRPSASLYTRLCSMYVNQTRYVFELKENDDVCRRALQLGSFYLFHNLSPFLRKSGRIYSAPAVSTSELQRILKECGRGEQKMEDSVLIGCTDSCVAEFALDLGPLERPSLEAELKGTFTDLRKAFLQLRGEDAPLLSRAQALLRWHEAHQYCSKTGKPTQKNVSGSKRVCSANGMIYYPQMSPVVITLVSHRNRCLLARQENFPEGMYTALAGFCDIAQREHTRIGGCEVVQLGRSGRSFATRPPALQTRGWYFATMGATKVGNSSPSDPGVGAGAEKYI